MKHHHTKSQLLNSLDFVAWSPFTLWQHYYLPLWSRQSVFFSLVFLLAALLIIFVSLCTWLSRVGQTTIRSKSSAFPLIPLEGLFLVSVSRQGESESLPQGWNRELTLQPYQCSRTVNDSISQDTCTAISWGWCESEGIQGLCSDSGNLYNSSVLDGYESFVSLHLNFEALEPQGGSSVYYVTLYHMQDTKESKKYAWDWRVAVSGLLTQRVYCRVRKVEYSRSSLYTRLFEAERDVEFSVSNVQTDVSWLLDEGGDGLVIEFSGDWLEDSFNVSSQGIVEVFESIGSIIVCFLLVKEVYSRVYRYFYIYEKNPGQDTLSIDQEGKRYVLSRKGVDIQNLETELINLLSFGSIDTCNLTTREIQLMIKTKLDGEEVPLEDLETLLMEYHQYNQEERLQNPQELGAEGNIELINKEMRQTPMFQQSMEISLLYQKVEELKYMVSKTNEDQTQFDELVNSLSDATGS